MYTLTKSLLCFNCFVSYMLPYRRPGRRVMYSLLVRPLEYVIFFKKKIKLALFYVQVKRYYF